MIGIKNIQNLYAAVNRLSKREKTVLYVTVFFVSVMLLDRLIIHPISSKIKSLNEEIQDKQFGIKRDMHILSQKERIALETTQMKPYLSANTDDQEELTSLLKDIEAIAAKSQIYLVDMKPAGVKEELACKKYLISLSCEGGMEQLISFMYIVENSSTLFTIEKYQINPKSRESSIAQCALSISKTVVQ
jgi:Tfp pilus assembly protein PilO